MSRQWCAFARLVPIHVESVEIVELVHLNTLPIGRRKLATVQSIFTVYSSFDLTVCVAVN